MVKHKRAIVTGGAGFIGSHLANELARRSYDVTILDDLSTGKRENIAALLDSTGHSNADFTKGSITDLPLLRRVFCGADFIFHQAALPTE